MATRAERHIAGQTASGQTEGTEGALVVVSKGHTLYHNGEKYPQYQRLEMDVTDATPLLKNGVIVAYSDLLKQVSNNGD